MMDFLPAIKDVVVQITDEGRSKALTRSAEVIVDDGTATDLRYKGDGVQSLAALALMRHAAETNSSGKHLIIAVEEPESHLHPKAMHSLKSVLRELADKHQVVITTHSPLFVNRNSIPQETSLSTKTKPNPHPRLKRFEMYLESFLPITCDTQSLCFLWRDLKIKRH